jgi:predicted MFS family arabinose efflux permease
MTATAMLGGFILIPNISAYVQENLDYPRARVALLYMVGGSVSFLVVPLAGKLVDRLGSLRVALIGSTALVAVVYAVFYREPAGWPVMPFFVAFMAAMGLRNVAYHTLASKVPRPEHRAQFMSLQSTVQHTASAAGGFFSGRLLGEAADGALIGMPRISAITIGLSVVLPLLIGIIEARVRTRGALPVAVVIAP